MDSDFRFSITIPLENLPWLPPLESITWNGDPAYGDRPLADLWCAEAGKRHWHPSQDVSRIGHNHDDFGYHGHDRCPLTGAPGRASLPEEWRS